MARKVEVIQAEIIAFKEAQPELATLSSSSKRAIWLLWTFVIASAIAIFEQLQDLYLAAVEAVVARSAAASNLWVQDKMFKFQYSSNIPQIIQLINTVPQYPVVNENLRIITACSVKRSANLAVNIKVAKGNTYQKLDAPELAAAQSHINIIGVAGINYTVISLDPDRLYIAADIFYAGQYSAVIKALVIQTIVDYLQLLSKVNFDGSLKMSDLEGTIRNISGVNDVILKEVKGRPLGGAYTALIQGTSIISRVWDPVAGYAVQEDTVGSTFLDTLNFIAQ
jgi:hypothetical protein